MNPYFLPNSFLYPQLPNSTPTAQNGSTSNINSPFTDLHRISQQNLILHVRNMQLNAMRNAYSNTTILPSKINNVPLESPNFVGVVEPLPLSQPLAPKISTPKSTESVKLAPREPFEQNKSKKIALKKQIDSMLRFIMANINGGASSEIDARRELYMQDSNNLLQIYDKLVMKYYSAKKCREDIVRYILRKFFKILRTNISRESKVSYRKTTLLLCKKYFSSKAQEMQDRGIKLENEEEVLEFFMPFRKNSKNKTMNTNFVCEIFSSQEICEEYDKFLKKFEKHINADNNIKVQKTIQVLMECAQKSDLSKLGSFNRFPWLDSWMENTINIAFSLKPNSLPDDSCSGSKIIKKEEGL